MFNNVSLLNTSKTPSFARMIVEIRQVAFVFIKMDVEFNNKLILCKITKKNYNLKLFSTPSRIQTSIFQKLFLMSIFI